MGGNSSSSKVSQVNNFFNQTTNSFISNNSQNVAASATNTNTIDFSGAEISGCSIKLGQNINSTVISTGQLTSQNISDLSTQLQNAAAAKIKDDASQTSGFLAPTVANNASAVTNLTNNVTNIIKNTMESNSVQDIFAMAKNVNIANMKGLKLTCDPSFRTPGQVDLTIDQNIISSVVAKGVSDALTKALSNVITANTSTADVAQTASQSSSGIEAAISAVTGPYAMICIAIAILLCVICGGLLAFMMSPAGQSATTTAAQAGNH